MMKSQWRKQRVRIALPVALFFFLAAFPAQAAQTRHWFGDPEMNRLYLFFSAFAREGIFAPETEEVERLATRYAAQYDPYSRFYSAEEYRAFQNSLSSVFGGVQMEIQALDDGRVICHPFLDGEAFRAGIMEGDRLVAVDGKALAGSDIHLVGMKIRGRPGTGVRLTVQTEGEAPRSMVLTRSVTRVRSVWKEQLGGYQTCRIHSFIAETPRQLRNCIAGLQQSPFLLLDLRGNAGGDLDAAIEAAAMFLRKKSEIVTLAGNSSRTVRYSENEQVITVPSVILLQNSHTASAAEVFIAALTGNRRAISVGGKSFGKGVTQKFIEFGDGSALLLSYAYLLPPGKVPYHGKGLEPTVAAVASSTEKESAVLLARLEDILAGRFQKARFHRNKK